MVHALKAAVRPPALSFWIGPLSLLLFMTSFAQTEPVRGFIQSPVLAPPSATGRERPAHLKKDSRLSLAAYNAGEIPVLRYKDIPPYPETQQYVRKVLRLYKTYQS